MLVRRPSQPSQPDENTREQPPASQPQSRPALERRSSSLSIIACPKNSLPPEPVAESPAPQVSSCVWEPDYQPPAEAAKEGKGYRRAPRKKVAKGGNNFVPLNIKGRYRERFQGELGRLAGKVNRRRLNKYRFF
jgi:hypothetical protein